MSDTPIPELFMGTPEHRSSHDIHSQTVAGLSVDTARLLEVVGAVSFSGNALPSIGHYANSTYCVVSKRKLNAYIVDHQYDYEYRLLSRIADKTVCKITYVHFSNNEGTPSIVDIDTGKEHVTVPTAVLTAITPARAIARVKKRYTAYIVAPDGVVLGVVDMCPATGLTSHEPQLRVARNVAFSVAFNTQAVTRRVRFQEDFISAMLAATLAGNRPISISTAESEEGFESERFVFRAGGDIPVLESALRKRVVTLSRQCSTLFQDNIRLNESLAKIQGATKSKDMQITAHTFAVRIAEELSTRYSRPVKVVSSGHIHRNGSLFHMDNAQGLAPCIAVPIIYAPDTVQDSGGRFTISNRRLRAAARIKDVYLVYEVQYFSSQSTVYVFARGIVQEYKCTAGGTGLTYVDHIHQSSGTDGYDGHACFGSVPDNITHKVAGVGVDDIAIIVGLIVRNVARMEASLKNINLRSPLQSQPPNYPSASDFGDMCVEKNRRRARIVRRSRCQE